MPTALDVPAGALDQSEQAFVNAIRALGVPVATGRFGAMMDVESINSGPVTLIVET